MKKILIILLAVCNFSCDYAVYHQGAPGGPGGNGFGGGSSNSGGETKTCDDGTGTADQVDFAIVKAEVFEPRCIGCHSSAGPAGGVNLEVYSAAAPIAPMILFDVQNDIMPKGPNKLTAEQKDLVARWVEGGAIEKVAALEPCDEPETTPRSH